MKFYEMWSWLAAGSATASLGAWKQSSAELPPRATWGAFSMSLPDTRIVRLVHPLDDRFNGSRRRDRPETLVRCLAMSTSRRSVSFLRMDAPFGACEFFFSNLRESKIERRKDEGPGTRNCATGRERDYRKMAARGLCSRTRPPRKSGRDAAEIATDNGTQRAPFVLAGKSAGKRQKYAAATNRQHGFVDATALPRIYAEQDT